MRPGMRGFLALVAACLLGTPLAAGAFPEAAALPADARTPGVAEEMLGPYDRDALEVLELINASTMLREQLPGFVEEARQAMAQHQGALPAAYTLRLAAALAQADTMRTRLFDQALRHRGTLYRIDPEFADEERLAGLVIAMAAATTLFENHNAMRASLDASPVLRKKLNEKYPEFGISANYYGSSMLRAANPEYRRTMTDAVRYFADNRLAIELHLAAQPESVRRLYTHVAGSSVLQEFSGASVLKEIAVLPGKALGGLVGLSGHELGRLQFRTSRLVGNTLGLVRWRSGKLKDDDAMLQTVLSHLQPGDILLEKTPFTLTDKTIPGHFGHVALYVGSADQLRELEGLDLPMVQKHLDHVAAGNGVVEALRNGVRLNPLRQFMNVDDLAVLRPRHLSREERLVAVNIALGNVGKQYDFNFDVNTTETIVCSELAYLAYPQVDFVTRRVLGSFTVSPDDIARRAGSTDDDPLEVVLFVHDGKLVHGRDLDQGGLALYESLVKAAPGVDAPDTAAAELLTSTAFGRAP